MKNRNLIFWVLGVVAVIVGYNWFMKVSKRNGNGTTSTGNGGNGDTGNTNTDQRIK